ncbi:acyl-CoA desaturase [soil metagenome]
MLFVIVFFFAHWYLSLFAQTFFHHRYAAHQMFSMSPFWEKFFFVYSYFVQGSSYLSPYVYGAMHRMHHAYADTELDPHSPKYDSGMMKMMMRTRKVYLDIERKITPNVGSFYKNLPTWEWFDKMASSKLNRLVWILIYIALYVAFAPSLWWLLVVPLHIIMGPLHGVVINWFAHKYGYINFEVKDTSKNLMPVDILMLGEGFHNNHHKYGARPNFGVKWFEIDPVYPFIWLFDKVGIVKLARQV